MDKTRLLDSFRLSVRLGIVGSLGVFFICIMELWTRAYLELRISGESSLLYYDADVEAKEPMILVENTLSGNFKGNLSYIYMIFPYNYLLVACYLYLGKSNISYNIVVCGFCFFFAASTLEDYMGNEYIRRLRLVIYWAFSIVLLKLILPKDSFIPKHLRKLITVMLLVFVILQVVSLFPNDKTWAILFQFGVL